MALVGQVADGEYGRSRWRLQGVREFASGAMLATHDKEPM
jgi:hypothetical protein